MEVFKFDELSSNPTSYDKNNNFGYSIDGCLL